METHKRTFFEWFKRTADKALQSELAKKLLCRYNLTGHFFFKLDNPVIGWNCLVLCDSRHYFVPVMASDIFYLPCPILLRPGPLIVRLGAAPCLTMPRLMKMSNQKHDLMSGHGLGCQDSCELRSHHTPGILTTGPCQCGTNGYTDVECIFGHLRLFYSGRFCWTYFEVLFWHKLVYEWNICFLTLSFVELKIRLYKPFIPLRLLCWTDCCVQSCNWQFSSINISIKR